MEKSKDGTRRTLEYHLTGGALKSRLPPPFTKTVTLIADVTVNPDVNRLTLKGLESGTPYQVQISGFTQTGVGVRSKAIAFTTDNHGYILSSDSKFPLRKLILTGFNSFSSS